MGGIPVRLACLALMILGGAAWAEEQASPPEALWLERLRQSADALHWSDEAIRHEWRLQCRPGTDECRILDPNDRVVHEGNRAACATALAEFEATGRVEPVHGPTVIVLHGLGESRRSMKPLVDHLRASLDATVLAFGYASTKAAIADHGRALATVVAGLPAAESVSLVGHSLGNLVARSWMGQADEGDLRRLGRMVMLGPPNQGSDLARMASRVWPLAALQTGAARDLAIDWQAVAARLPAPQCPFGIVAGGKGDGAGYSLLLDGDDDAVVRVAETHLDGADDFLLLPIQHAAMMKSPTVQEAVTAFLATGQFPRSRAASEPPP